MIVALAGQKGGVGRTTTAISLVVRGLELGRSVLLVDADPQASASTWWEVAKREGHPVPRVARMGPTLGHELPPMAREFELVVVDCAPRLAQIQRATLLVAHKAIIPSSGSPSDVWAIGESARLVKEVRRERPKLDARILLTRQRATSIGEGAREALRGAELPLLRAELGMRTVYELAVAAGLGPTTFAPSSLAADEVRKLFREVVDA